MSAAEIAKALGGNGRSGMCCCPVHEDRTPSLSLKDGKRGRLLVHCFAGCDPHLVLEKLRNLGLLEDSARNKYKTYSHANLSKVRHVRSSTYALEIWKRSFPAEKTLVEKYLRSRGYKKSIPSTLRFHPSLKHTPTGMVLPAMIGGVCVAGGNSIVAIHRTYLTAKGDKISGSHAKMCLGSVRGGAVQLAPAGEVLAVTEGIETALSVMLATQIPTWAALSAGGIEKLILPSLPCAREIIICADNDAHGVGQRAAKHAATKWLAEGRMVKIVIPPHPDSDFNDLLNMESA